MKVKQFKFDDISYPSGHWQIQRPPLNWKSGIWRPERHGNIGYRGQSVQIRGQKQRPPLSMPISRSLGPCRRRYYRAIALLFWYYPLLGNYCRCHRPSDQSPESITTCSITPGGGPTSKCDGVKLPKAVVEIPVDGTFLPQETYECRDQLYKNRSSRKIDSRRIFSRE